MKRIFITFLLSICLFIVYCRQLNAQTQHPHVQDLWSIAQITFPDTPTMDTTAKYSDRYIYKGQNGCSYMVSIRSLTKNTSELLTRDIEDSVYNRFIAKGGIFKGKLFYKNRIDIQGLRGIEYAHKATYPTFSSYHYYRVFYFNDKMIDFAVWSLDSLKKDDKKITGFFDTFKLKMNRADIRQGNAADIWYRSRGMARAIGVIMLVLLFGGLIVFVIVKMT